MLVWCKFVRSLKICSNLWYLVPLSNPKFLDILSSCLSSFRSFRRNHKISLRSSSFESLRWSMAHSVRMGHICLVLSPPSIIVSVWREPRQGSEVFAGLIGPPSKPTLDLPVAATYTLESLASSQCITMGVLAPTTVPFHFVGVLFLNQWIWWCYANS